MADSSIILVIDASEDHLVEVVGSLRGAGWNAVGTTDPWEALQILTQVSPNLIVLDLDLPGYAVTDFCSLLVDDPGLKSIPAVYLWSQATENPSPLRPDVMDMSLEKPVGSETLEAAVRRLLVSPFPPEQAAADRSPTRFTRRRRDPVSAHSA